MKKWICLLVWTAIFGGCAFMLTYQHSARSLEKETPLVIDTQDEEHYFIVLMSDALKSMKKEGSVWPSYSFDRPVIITFDNGHIYALGLTPHHSAWQEYSIEGRSILFSPVDYWDVGHIFMQKDFSVDGQLAFVFHYDLLSSALAIKPLVSLLNECFQLYQSQSFQHLPHTDAPEYLDHFNLPNIAWMQIEEMVLADFMHSLLDHEKSSFHKTAHLRDLLAVQYMRRQLLQPSSLEWEGDMQRLGGSADYVATKQIEELFNSDFNACEYLLTALQTSNINEEILEHAISWRHHSIGAAIGYALDFLEVPNWKERLMYENLSPSELLQEAIPIQKDELVARIEKVKSRYGYSAVLQQVTAAIKGYQEELADLIGGYARMEGIEIHLPRLKEYSKSHGDSSLYSYYLADGSQLCLADTSSQKANDGSWQLLTLGAPMVIKKCDHTIILKVEASLVVTLDGHPHLLSELVNRSDELSFDTLSLQGRYCEFHSTNRAGVLRIHNNQLSVLYHKPI